MKRGTPRHPKVSHLAEILAIKLYAAVGILEMLWHFAAEFCPQGDIGRYEDRRIAAAVSWSGRSDKLIDALVTAHWIDRDSTHRLVVHDWHIHADDAVKKRLERAKKPFLSDQQLAAKLTEHRPSGSPTDICLPVPVPSQSRMPEPSRVLAHAQAASESPAKSRVRRAPTVTEIDGAASPKFGEWWDRWSRLTGLVQHKEAAARAWVSVVKTGDEDKIAACLERYGASDQVARGVITNPDKWLFDQNRNAWAGDWPPRKASSGNTRQQQNADAWSRA